MVTVSESWRLADKALHLAQTASDKAAAYAASGDAEMAYLWLHAAHKSAEKAVEHLAVARVEVIP